MSRIAFVSGFYVYGGRVKMTPEQIFMFECLYDSAKKYFLKNHEVEFIFITNSYSKIEGVNTIKIDKKITGYHEMLLMKILCVDYLKEQYDYIFVNDGDQIFVDHINDDLLEHNFNIQRHFYNPAIDGVLENLSPFINIECDRKNNHWTMGNFFGGKSDEFLRLLNKTKEYHERYKNFYHKDIGFYAIYPDEVFLVKYLNEESVDYNWLKSITIPGEVEGDFFVSDFQDDINFYPNFTNVKLLHNTKKNLSVLKEIIKYYK